MGKNIYIVYECDQWLSCSSMRVKCVCSTKESAIRNVLKNRKTDGWDSDEIREELENCSQTHGHAVNYHIEEATVGEWV